MRLNHSIVDVKNYMHGYTLMKAGYSEQNAPEPDMLGLWWCL